MFGDSLLYKKQICYYLSLKNECTHHNILLPQHSTTTTLSGIIASSIILQIKISNRFLMLQIYRLQI